MAKRDPNKPKKQARPGQKAGYCLPPESGQTKPGEVRNPWGPNGKPKPVVEDPYETVMSQTTRSVIDGKATDISVELGILMVHAQKALAGSTASLNALIRARPRRGERFEIMKTLEGQKEDEEKLALSKELAQKYIGILDEMADMKHRLGDKDASEGKSDRDHDSPEPDPDPAT